ncbi:hypothetical protein BSAE_1717 [Bifidobacterium pullorum subsp. saeculare DSM 6531 = LMG 14934]|uniref:Zinc-ribbon domain-containing protein n=1 Tax=Bifidobacterium pullorum subsp. saeculare DSM 6531 = LMG 14934 TaxID=1437611 RepID=A0A087CS67_9BIFI|nr:zinc ribbon domain-containing protein [Bifidobacterium pullorum]KFI86117.1 hypothetical protein BSAE_1717 [Bifidobacterium pullorum subsp. saeculare DSM 6531 = LMG 14934]
MFCESCGHPLNPSDKFCTGCGAPVSRPDSVTTVMQRNDGQETIVAEGESLINGVSESSLSDDHEATDATPADTSDDGDGTDAQPERINTVGDDMNGTNGPDDVDDRNNDDNQNGARRRRLRIAVGIVAAVVVMILVVVAAVMVVPRLFGGTGGTDSVSDRNVVYYGSSKATKVRPSTTIVLYGDDGEPLDKYDVTVMDESGEVTTTHVTDGEFTPAEVGAEPGDTYSVIARDPDGTVLDVPDLDIVEQQKNPDDGDNKNDEIHDELVVKPETDEDNDSNDSAGPNKNDVQTSNARRTAYALFYDKIQELQDQYGEGQTVDGPRADEQWAEGLSFVRLLDFNEDGIEELVVAHCPQGLTIDYNTPGYMDTFMGEFNVEVYQFNSDTSTLDQVYAGPTCFTNGGLIFVNIRADHNGGYAISGVDNKPISDDADTAVFTENQYVLASAEDGTLKSVTLSTETIGMYTQNAEQRYYIDGKAVDEQQFNEQQDKLGLTDPTAYELHSTLYNPGFTEDEYSCQKTLDDTKTTVEQILQGMMHGFDDGTVDSANVNRTKDSEAWKQAYIDRINQEANDSAHGTSGTYMLIDIDGNDIPEVYTRWSSEAEGGDVYSYAQGKVIEQSIDRSGFSYIEGQSLFMNYGGVMGNYFNLVYSIENGRFVEVANGQYVEENNNGNWSYRYYWDGKEVSESEYADTLNDVYDTSQAVDPLENATFNASTFTYTGNGIYDLNGIISAIRSY